MDILGHMRVYHEERERGNKQICSEYCLFPGSLSQFCLGIQVSVLSWHIIDWLGYYEVETFPLVLCRHNWNQGQEYQ